jgi:DNA-directed RNA polymerase specialized sigma24 family protein
MIASVGRKDSKAHKIVELFEQGLSHIEIARALNCSRPNVTATLSRYDRGFMLRITGLSSREYKDLEDLAQNHQQSIVGLARQILREALAEAKTQSKSSSPTASTTK